MDLPQQSPPVLRTTTTAASRQVGISPAYEFRCFDELLNYRIKTGVGTATEWICGETTGWQQGIKEPPHASKS